MSLKTSSKDSKIFSFISENREGSTSSLVVPSLYLNLERMIPSEVQLKEDMEAPNHTVVDMVTMEDTVATSHMATEVATVETNHMVVAEATKVATKEATSLVIEEVPRAASPTTEPSLLATLASIAKSLM